MKHFVTIYDPTSKLRREVRYPISYKVYKKISETLRAYDAGPHPNTPFQYCLRHFKLLPEEIIKETESKNKHRKFIRFS